MNQEKVFLHGEGDNWYLRNREMITNYPDDICQEYILGLGVKGKNILEMGCSVGHRLAQFAEAGAHCLGIDASRMAIKEGSAMYPNIKLLHGTVNESFFPGATFDIVLMSFILHWVDRNKLLMVIANADRLLKDGGTLIIQDFYPSVPHKREYHHNLDLGIYTYKQPYWDIFEATHMYKRIARHPHRISIRKLIAHRLCMIRHLGCIAIIVSEEVINRE